MESKIEFKRVDNDTNGNPRYVCHFLNFITPDDAGKFTGLGYDFALARAKKLGGRKFHNKQYGGGIVFQSYNIGETERQILELVKESSAPKAPKSRALIQKYLDIIKTGKIEESALISLLSVLNGGRGKATQEEKRLLLDALNEGNLTLSKAQNEKGLAWLMDQWKTPRGVERKNNPFGYREQAILENFSHFELRSVYDGSRYGSPAYYLPLYECVGNNTSFEYYVHGGQIHITG